MSYSICFYNYYTLQLPSKKVPLSRYGITVKIFDVVYDEILKRLAIFTSRAECENLIAISFSNCYSQTMKMKI